MIKKEVKFSDLNILPRDVYDAMGYKGHVPDVEVAMIVDEILEQVSGIARPRFCFLIDDGEVNKDLIIIRNIMFNIGKTIAVQLRKSEKLVSFIATAGDEFNNYLEEVKETKDILYTYILDAIGSEIAERTADSMELALGEEISVDNWWHTNRYSPGYCGWKLLEQRQLFKLFSGNTCGVSLSESCLMTPIKSVSGVLGIGSLVSKKEYSCNICDYKDCFRRKESPVSLIADH